MLSCHPHYDSETDFHVPVIQVKELRMTGVKQFASRGVIRLVSGGGGFELMSI